MRENAVWIPVRPKPNAFPADARSISLLFQNIPRCKKAEKKNCNTEEIENLTVPGQKSRAGQIACSAFFLSANIAAAPYAAFHLERRLAI